MPSSRHQSPTTTSPSSLASRIATAPAVHDDGNPLWAGSCGEGPLGGITQSMLVRFLSCRERFRLRYVLGLEPHDKWNHRLGYGNMWHVCEEALASEVSHFGEVVGTTLWEDNLDNHTMEQMNKFPLQHDEIDKWYHVCRVQFPEYVSYWSQYSDVQNRIPLMQEQVFDVPYHLPSGRVVRLRGKFDSVDLIDEGIYLQENKTKGDIDRQQVERQLTFDLQTMMYLIAYQTFDENPTPCWKGYGPGGKYKMVGVRYNVVRRPLSGGKGTIKQSEGTKGSKCPKCKGAVNPACQKCFGSGRVGGKPAETDEAFYERLRRDYIAAEPDYWFFRVRAEVGARDVQVFKDTCLDPLLETVCCWYEQITGSEPCNVGGYPYTPPFNYRTPFGVYSALEEGGATEYDAYLATGSEAGLRRVDKLFTELQ